MKLSSETIYDALFKTICAINGSQTPLRTMSRRWKKWDELGDVGMPAFYQRQTVMPVSQQKFGLSKYHLKAELWFYFEVINDDIPDSPLLNLYFDAVDKALAPSPYSVGGARQQLGLATGIENAWIDGAVIWDEGLLIPPAILLVPVTITTG